MTKAGVLKDSKGLQPTSAATTVDWTDLDGNAKPLPIPLGAFALSAL